MESHFESQLHSFRFFLVHSRCLSYCLTQLDVPPWCHFLAFPYYQSESYPPCLEKGRNCLPSGVGPVNEGAADRFGTIYKNRSFIKEKGFHHPDNFFGKTIVAKGWRALFQPPHLAAMSVVQEFYANLASHVIKKVRVRGVLVDFSAELINHYYILDHVPSEPFDRLFERPDYPEFIRVLTNGQGEWKLNSEGHAIHFKAKHLAFIPMVWHHFITSRLIPTTNVCEVTAKCALLNYAIIQDIPFDVG